MKKETFESSRTIGSHFQLARLTGKWEGMTKTFFEPGIVADESPWTGSIRPILDGMFMIHEYSGSLQGKALQGVAIYGYDLGSGYYQSAWIDSFHNGTALMFSKKQRFDNNFSVIGSYDSIDGTPSFGWRTSIDIINSDHITITMYNITPDGKELNAVETIYHRDK